jgi:glycosyltransferase involved in cell wall biosynthesis
VIRDQENGLIVSSDPEELALAIERLRSDEVLRQRIGTAARRILERFEREKLVREYAEFLKRC